VPPADNNETVKAILDVLKSQNDARATNTSQSNLLSSKNINALVIAAIIGAVAFMWNGVTEQPAKNADQFAAIQSQNAEIRTTVLELKSGFVILNGKFDAQQKDTAEVRSKVDTNAAQIEALVTNVKANSDRISQLEKDTR
jgi:hypothetical protein